MLKNLLSGKKTTFILIFFIIAMVAIVISIVNQLQTTKIIEKGKASPKQSITKTPLPTAKPTKTPIPTLTPTPSPGTTNTPTPINTPTSPPSSTNTPTPTPTEIILAQSISTPPTSTKAPQPSVPAAGTPERTLMFIVIPAIILILGLIF